VLSLAASVTWGEAKAGERLWLGAIPNKLDSAPGRLTVDDFDGDGSPDLAIILESAGFVSVSLNSRDESFFHPPTIHVVGVGPVFITSGDLNGDDLSELVIANVGSSNLAILENEGGGHFSEAALHNVGIEPLAVAIADFDRDGRNDIVVGNFRSADAHVLFGDGKTGIEQRVRVLVGDNPHHLAVGDFNGDEIPDIAIAHSGELTWFHPEDGRTFRRAEGINMEPDPRVVSAGDFDEDGVDDLIVLNDRGDLFIFSRLDQREFKQSCLGSIDFFRRDRLVPAVLEATDFNGDGHLDVLTELRRVEDFGLRVRLGDGEGIFLDRYDVFVDGLVSGAAISELDEDGLTDLVVTRTDQAAFDLILGIAPGELSARRVVEIDMAPRDVALVNVDGPADPGVLVLAQTGLFRYMPGAGEEPQTELIRPYLTRSLVDFVVADFNGDGFDDVAMIDSLIPALLIVFLDQRLQILDTIGHRLNALPNRVVLDDFDEDGSPDLAVSDRASRVVRVILHAGSEEAAKIVDVPFGTPQTSIASGDVDGDGDSDLVVSTAAAVKVLLGDGRGAFAEGPELPESSSAVFVTVGDLDAHRADGDPAAEVVLVRRQKIEIAYDIEGERAKTSVLDIDAAQLRSVRVVDVNRDSVPDLVALDQRSVVVSLGEEEGFGSSERYGVGSDPREFVLVEADEGRRRDLITADFGSSGLSWLRGAGGDEGPLFSRGDVDASGDVTLSDAVQVLDRLFRGGESLSCADAGDVDDDGELTLTDAVRLLGFLFQGGAPPPSPGADACGRDPTDDELTHCEDACAS